LIDSPFQRISPAFRRQQADQHAQQAGFARAVAALQMEQFSGFQPEAEAREQAALAAHAFQIVSFKHQGKKPKEIRRKL
jgi:hypothetical protein